MTYVGDQVLNFTKHGQVVFGLGVLGINDLKRNKEKAQRTSTVSTRATGRYKVVSGPDNARFSILYLHTCGQSTHRESGHETRRGNHKPKSQAVYWIAATHGDTVALSNAENRGIDVCCTGLEGAESVCHSCRDTVSSKSMNDSSPPSTHRSQSHRGSGTRCRRIRRHEGCGRDHKPGEGWRNRQCRRYRRG